MFLNNNFNEFVATRNLIWIEMQFLMFLYCNERITGHEFKCFGHHDFHFILEKNEFKCFILWQSTVMYFLGCRSVYSSRFEKKSGFIPRATDLQLSTFLHCLRQYSLWNTCNTQTFHFRIEIKIKKLKISSLTSGSS